MPKPSLTVICTYRVQRPREKDFLRLLRAHWPALRRLGLVTTEPSVAYRGEEERGHPFYVEIFTWKSARAVRGAHAHPEVAAIWEPMGTMCEPRGSRPAMEFPHVARVKLGRGA